jgi:hypothetical protein
MLYPIASGPQVADSMNVSGLLTVATRISVSDFGTAVVLSGRSHLPLLRQRLAPEVSR